MSSQKVSIVGAGPSGLFCAYLLLKNGFKVDLYDSNPGIGRKFLIAGKGGLNITKSEEQMSFSKKYGKDQLYFHSLLKDFGPEELVQWCNEIGIETFVGSTKRVFPEKFNAGDFLNKWKDKLNSFEGYSFYANYILTDVTKEKTLTFDFKETKKKIHSDIIILAMGGASWKKTGSNGLWVAMLDSLGVKISSFLPMNCGFEVQWSDVFLKKVEGKPLKNISIKFKEESIKGELMITSYGLEGGAIYAISNKIRDEILKYNRCEVLIDLIPKLTKEEILNSLKSMRTKDSLKNTLRKKLKLSEESYQLLLEKSDRLDINNAEYLVEKIKNTKVELKSIRPIDEAISTGGGVCFSNLTDSLEFKEIPNLYCAGEMLDFEAMTGGYLLQGCFSTSYRVVKSIIASFE